MIICNRRMANKGCAINVAKAKERCLHETERILASMIDQITD
jgi:hypothetical protein